MKNIGPVLSFAVAATLFLSSGANAQFGGRPTLLPQQGGEAIYKGICQDCHMPDARGAVGAGMYPALAGNPKLEIAGYPVALVIHGQKAMPAFGDAFSDQQIADVVNYVRTHFGNAYRDEVTPADVKGAR
jgi:mono/diheme cytochrome c family protein